MQHIKEKLHLLCIRYVEERLKRIENRMFTIRESLNSETKSTAGDKHETGRAMLQLEREKAGVQLAEVIKLKTIISKVNISQRTPVIRLGSLVFTTTGNYYICISAGELKIENNSYFAIAADTPIGQLLMGKTKKDLFSFRGEKITITEIY